MGDSTTQYPIFTQISIVHSKENQAGFGWEGWVAYLCQFSHAGRAAPGVMRGKCTLDGNEVLLQACGTESGEVLFQ